MVGFFSVAAGEKIDDDQVATHFHGNEDELQEATDAHKTQGKVIYAVDKALNLSIVVAHFNRKGLENGASTEEEDGDQVDDKLGPKENSGGNWSGFVLAKRDASGQDL